MWTFRKNTIIGIVGLALATLAVAPANADDRRHGRWGDPSARYERDAHVGKDRKVDRGRDRHARRAARHHGKRFNHPRRVVYHHRGRTVIIVPERPRRRAIRHGYHLDPVVRALIGPLNW